MWCYREHYILQIVDDCKQLRIPGTYNVAAKIKRPISIDPYELYIEISIVSTPQPMQVRQPTSKYSPQVFLTTSSSIHAFAILLTHTLCNIASSIFLIAFSKFTKVFLVFAHRKIYTFQRKSIVVNAGNN